MANKHFWFDVETTGLDKKENALTQLACIVVINGVEVDRLNININPMTYNRPVTIADQALAVTGKTMEDLESHPDSREQFNLFLRFLDKYINKYDKTDKFQPIGYNSQFDMGFLQEWFIDNSHKYFGSYFNGKDVDVFALVKHFAFLGFIHSDNHKLVTMCTLYGVDLGDSAHDALADIRATRELYKTLVDRYVVQS